MKTIIAPIIAVEGRKFLETTTILGVQRIVKSKSRVHFIFWLLAILASTALLIWQLSKLFIRYSEHPVNTVFVQSPNWQSPVFPDITICNLCPLVHEKEMSVRYSDYITKLNTTFTLDAVLDKLVSGFGREKIGTLHQNVIDYLVSPTAYFLNLPNSSAHKIDVNTTPFLNCEYFDWDYNPNNNFGCLSQIKPIWDPEFYKCYTSSLSKSKRKQVRGFSAIIHVENFIGTQIVNFEPDLRNPQSTGIQVMIHAPGTIPDMKLGMSIGPGIRTTIALDQLVRIQQPAPYSNCTDQQYIGSKNVAYSQDYCVDICIQHQYIKQCRCILGARRYTPQQLIDANDILCGNLSMPDGNSSIPWSMFEKFFCAAGYDEDDDKCIAKCFSPCVQFSYGKSISGSSWPHISAQTSFYVTYIKNKSRFGGVYDGYEIVIDNIFKNDSIANTKLQNLDRKGLIRNNFLQLNVMFNSRTYNEQKDDMAISVEALLGQFGGILNLWLGISSMLVFEICEFLVALIVTSYQARRAKSNTISETSDIKL